MDTSYKDIKKRHIGYIISFIFFIIAGFIFAFITDIFPGPSYEDLLSKTITIEDVHITYSGHDNILIPKEETNYCFDITTDINEKYSFSTLMPEGKKIEAKLQKGTVADIKYYKNQYFPIYYIQELTVGNEIIYPYEYTADTNKTEAFKIAVFLWVFSFFPLCYYFYIVNKDIQKTEEKRNAHKVKAQRKKHSKK